jgi:hypothetical membrane protein
MARPDINAWAVRAGLACGVAAPVLWVLTIALCGALTPGHDHLNDFISELAAREAPTEFLMRNVGFLLSGGCYVAFAAALGWRSRFDMLALVGAGFIALGGVARMLAGVHACDPGCSPLRPSPDQELHNAAARIAYLAMIVAAIYWGVVGNRYAALRRLSPLGIGCGVWAVVFLVLMIAVGSTEGLFQRLASGVLTVWMLVFALTVYRAGPVDEPLAPAPDDPRTTGAAA